MEGREARLYEKLPENRVRCNLCAHRCVITDGGRGICQVRENRDGTLYTLVYGRVIARHVDPVEKKPLFHVYPGSTAYSIATPGCNFRCKWCQNWEISQMPREQHLIMGEKATPEQIVAAARRHPDLTVVVAGPQRMHLFAVAEDLRAMNSGACEPNSRRSAGNSFKAFASDDSCSKKLSSIHKLGGRSGRRGSCGRAWSSLTISGGTRSHLSHRRPNPNATTFSVG